MQHGRSSSRVKRQCSQAAFIVVLLVVSAFLLVPTVAELSPDDAQDWRAKSLDFDWQQPSNTQVRIVGRGTPDTGGNLYFVGTKTYADAQGNFIDDSNMFVARINADDTLGWTKEFGTNQTDGANFVAVMNESVSGTITQCLYVVGWTWGFMDDGGHALNGFGRFGGRDVVLLKLRLDDGRKIWTRQFGSTADDIGYGVQRDGGFDTVLLTGVAVTNQADAIVEVDVGVRNEPRQKPFSLYETQLMEARARQNAYTLTKYQFAASLKRTGEIVDFAMDGGLTITSRRQRIAENSTLVGEYAVVLNRQPLDNVTVTATIVCLVDPGNQSLSVQQLAFVSSPTSERRLVFTPKSWNREQLVRVVAVDDAIAEGVHYAVITHRTASSDPHFNGANTPFLYGRNITMQIDDDDVPGVQLSRRHTFVGEGGLNDTYEVVLRSRPWFPVNVTIVSLHASQAFATPSLLTFKPSTWNISQVVTVSAVDDELSENEYGGLHFGGRLLHYSDSDDRRYRTGRPKCYDLPRCDPQDSTICLSANATETFVRVCDLTAPYCGGRLGNGACIAAKGRTDYPPERFGAGPFLSSERNDGNDQPLLSYDALKAVLADQAQDAARVSPNANISETYPFRYPPPRLRGLVLSFLGLLNFNQAVQLHKNFRASLQAVCSGLDRVTTHRWTTQGWPSESFPRVLNATLKMFGGSVAERHLWQCGMASFRPGSSVINISIWDNDPGVTLSSRFLKVAETNDSGAANSIAQYSIVLNAPPSPKQPKLQRSYCAFRNSDDCGLWSEFQTIASAVYTNTIDKPLPNVTIAILGNSQLSLSPAFVTFTSENWFVPQWITVRAANDDLAEDGLANLLISHRVQNSAFGYRDERTAFWFRSASPVMSSLFPRWSNVSEADRLPYNYLPRAIYSPNHRQINVQVEDNDAGGVIIRENQPFKQVNTRESDDSSDDWVGDLVRSFAFSEVSLTKISSASNALGMGPALRSVLVFEKDSVTFMKFHLPERRDGDTHPKFSFARVRVYETPFKVINSSSGSGNRSPSSTAFETIFDLQVTVVDNAWSAGGVSNGSVDPATAAFLRGNHSITVSALLTKQRYVSIDVTPLIQLLLLTRLPVVSLKIRVLGSTTPSVAGGVTAAATTQLCSSLFARALRPTLSIGYTFPNRLQGRNTTQSSNSGVASLAVDGDRESIAGTNDEVEAWWEVTLPRLTRLGSLGIFLPQSMSSADVINSPAVLVVVATLIPLNGQPLNLSSASEFGCPSACPRVQRVPVRKSLIITELNGGVRSLRIYREGLGALQLMEVEAYDTHVILTPTANGAGLRSRLKMDWNGRLRSSSWRILQSVRQSDDENLARGMRTRQSSTDPFNAVSSLAVDGQRKRAWDPLVLMSNASDAPTAAGSTRTLAQTDPWWEVDLGASLPISRIEIFPFVGQSGRGYCDLVDASTKVPGWAGDLVSFSKTDTLLQLQDPFQQTFQVLLSESSLASDGSASANTTLVFSCAGGVVSVAWSDVFARARFVTVKRLGMNAILMLNEVVVTRWNPATTPQLLLVELRGDGAQPIALSSIQLFAPTDDAAPSSFAVPVPYTIHSVSSQRAPSGDGSASALTDVTTPHCYVAGQASFREWIVLKLSKPTRLGLIDIQTSIDACGASVSQVSAFSVAARGHTLDGIRLNRTEAALTATTPVACSLTMFGTLLTPTSADSCEAFVCEAPDCRSTRRSTDAVFSDFNDIVVLGMPSLVPTKRLPLSQHETRSILLRDNPVVLWTFDMEPRTAISATRTAGVYDLGSASATKSFSIDDDLEQSFFSNAVAVQPAMSAFSIELWVRFSGTVPTVGTLVTVATQSNTAIADVAWTSQAPKGVFTVRDPISGTSCSAVITSSDSVFGLLDRWYHVVASYDPTNARISLSIRYRTGLRLQDVALASSSKSCSLPLLSVKDKAVHVGAFSSSSGFSGSMTSIAWYVDVLTDRQLLDHFHDFFTRGTNAPRHNSYTVQLASKPSTPVTVEINAESACYSFVLCNVTALPRVISFTPEDWNIPQNVFILATDDQLFEGLHHTKIVHNVSSLPTYELQSRVTTENLVEDVNKWKQYRGTVIGFDRGAIYMAQSLESLHEQGKILNEIQANWSTQRLESQLVVCHPYKESLVVRHADIEIEDATIAGIQFSTNSLIVSEAGKGNDYQILLLSAPTSDVRVILDTQSDCYRDCFPGPQCPSQSADGKLLCGGGSAGTKLCNITVSPEVLVFTPENWTFPLTVRVVAVNDLLDEADLHLTTIKASSQSLDPIYNALFLPDIVVGVEDNDDSTINYSTLAVAMKENDPAGTTYGLHLLTEPWSNVTIAMSNEADGSCYRRCGYPFDEKKCGLPRQQTVSSVRLASKSPREIHEISLNLPQPRVMEVQRIATFSDHVDHIFSVQVTGGFSPEVQMIEFAFNSAFKTRFKSAAAIETAGIYIRSFKIGASGRATQSLSLDGFASAVQVETAINGLILGRAGSESLVRVSRELRYDNESALQWRVTFLRLISEDLSFPQLTAIADSPFEGNLTTKRVSASVAPSGNLLLQYGKSNVTSVAAFPLMATKSDIEGQLRDIDTVYTALSSRKIVTTLSPPVYGLTYLLTFTSVDTYETLRASVASLVGSNSSLSSGLQVTVTELQAPARIDGYFTVQYDSPYVNCSVNATVRPRQTAPLAWNVSGEDLGAELARLHGVGNVSVSRRRLTPEGGMDWTIGFINNNGNLSTLLAKSLNLTGKNVGVQTAVVVDGVSLGGTFRVEMGGSLMKTHPVSQRVYTVTLAKQNTTDLPYNVSARTLAHRLALLNITERANVTRVGRDCDEFEVCEGYTWTVSYVNSSGNLPPIQVYGTNDTLRGNGAVLTSRTVANGTYLDGYFSLELELLDPETNITHRGKTWNLPVNVSAPGMDQALEAIRFVRSNREEEYDPETRLSRGMKFDKGVRVFREGPYLDGGYTWRLEWAIEDYVRFQDLRITINTSLVTQLIEPLQVPSERDLLGTPRCSAIPMARFQPDKTDPFGLRGFCVYDLANVTIQERYLCNYTVANPWIVFSPQNWCTPQQVVLTPVDDFIDEATIKTGNITFSNITHTVFSDDLIYARLPLKQVRVSVESDDVARILVSESHLDVSEDGSKTAYYNLQLTTEPLYDVKIVVLPWLDSADTKCYRFGLCNVTLDVDKFVFTPRNWNVPQRVVVKATDDNLDEFDVHDTGISHVSYSDDLKYHQLTNIPKIAVTVTDNDNSGFFVSKASVNVTEGGAEDTYEVVLGSEPFAKVTIDIQNIGTKGDFATATPSRLVFTWLNWNKPQTVRMAAVDDSTQDPVDSSSVMVHTITTNDVIYANLQSLSSVRVWIRDDDVSGIDLSTRSMAVNESAQPYAYSLRLTSEPWYPVVVLPSGANNCYVRVATQQRICNASVITTALYFGASNWSQWQTVSFLALDDSLEESPIHAAMITHASSSKDPLYVSADYKDRRVTLAITDNDVSFVNISLAITNTTTRSRLHVAEGGFNDSYTIVLQSEPYENVEVSVAPRIERIVSVDTAVPPVDAAQVGTSVSSRLSSVPSGSMLLVFTPQDWFLPRLVTVFGIDDQIPEDPTQFSAINHAMISADPKYNISNASTGIVDVAVIISDREAIPPPMPVSAMFDAAGTRIAISFDSSVYHASTMVVRPTSAGSTYALRFPTFNCSLVFSSQLAFLGTGALCAWQSDLKRLTITLGTGATVLPNDVLLLHECSSFVNQVCQSDSVLRARHTSRAYTQATITIRLDPNVSTAPRIVMSMPEQVGTCGAWIVDAGLSTGSVGRSFKDHWWLILPKAANAASTVTNDAWVSTSRSVYSDLQSLCAKYDQVSALNRTDLIGPLSSFVTTLEQMRSLCYLRAVATAATTTNALQIQLNSSLLLSDTTYVVGLSLSNAFSQQAMTVQSVKVGKLPSPIVFAVGDSSLQISRGESTQPVLLQADATLSCPLLAGSQITFRWYATVNDTLGAGSSTSVDLNATNTARDPRVFRIPRSRLQAGKTYRLRVEASVPQAASSSAFFTVRVVSSPLVAVIGGGNRSVGEKDTLNLNASLSIDPDLEPEPFVYTWRCEDWTNETMALIAVVPCANASSSSLATVNLPTASSQPVLALEPFTLAPERTLRFFLTVSKHPTPGTKTSRSATIQTTVWTSRGSVPEIVIEPTATKLNPSSRVILNAAVKSTYPYTARWLEDQGDLDLPDEGSNITTIDAFTMPLTSPSNAIRRNRLTPGQRYTLRLVAVDINGNTGFGTVSFEVNAPPSPGRFQISPREGEAMVDAFTIDCQQWTDDPHDLPLRYSFGVLPTATFSTLAMNVSMIRQRMLPLVSDQLLPTATATMLPPEGLANSSNMTVVAFITDALGGTAVAFDSIIVYMPEQAASQPVAFASSLVANVNGSDAATQTKTLFSAALVLQRALGDSGSATECPGTGSSAGVCSGNGKCDLKTFVCACATGFMGSACQFLVADVRSVNTAVLASLGSEAVQSVEPSSSGLSQQALIIDTVLQSSFAAFDGDGVGQVTGLTSTIAQNAFTLQDASDFVDTTGSTLLSSLSTVLTVTENVGAEAASLERDPAPSSRRTRRRLADGSLQAQESCANETVTTSTSFQKLMTTLQSLAAVASQDLLPEEEDPVQLAAGQITTFTSAGSRLSAASSSLRVNLTSAAVACLGTGKSADDLFVNAFQLSSATHSVCSLKEAKAISRSTVVTVHDKATVASALAGKTNGIVTPLTLTSTSFCVGEATARDAAAGKSATRRLDESDSTLAAWRPLITLSLPHTRLLTATEQRNFTTGCRSWNAQRGVWETDVCLKDDTQSSPTQTVCYCNEIRGMPGLEVLVTLEERLDFYALSRDLYRDDEPSVVVPISMAILVGIIYIGAKYGQVLDSADDKKDKEKTIMNLNRAKWSELNERAQSAAIGAEPFEDFATFMAKREAQKKALDEASATTAATSDSHLLAMTTAEGIPAEQLVQLVEEGTTSLPNETRVLFGSSARLDRLYGGLSSFLRGANVILVVVGLVAAFVGIDFYLALGNSTASDLVLLLYGKSIGLVLVVFAGILILLGLWGLAVAKQSPESTAQIARSAYGSLLLICLVGQLFFVFLAFRYVNDLDQLPLAGLNSLRAAWEALPTQRQDEIQSSYGCCGFSSIVDAARGCPEEALDSTPPRTCVKVIETHARTLFQVSFVFLQIVFLVQVAVLLLIQTLQSWRRLRMAHLLDSTTIAPSSALEIAIMCTFPSVLKCLVGLAALILFTGVDFIVQLHVLSSPVFAGILGMEVGVAHLVTALGFALVLFYGLHAIRRCDATRLLLFGALTAACLLLTVALSIFAHGFHDHWLLDPTVVDFVHTKYLQLSRETLVAVETSLECCGFTSSTEGACVGFNPSGGAIPTCRNVVLGVLHQELDVLRRRLVVFSGMQAAVLAIAIVAAVRVRRIRGGVSHVRPLEAATAALPTVVIRSLTHALIYHTSFMVVAIGSATAFVLGLVVVGAGLDAMYQLNVLHLSMLLRVFDRHVAVYLFVGGGCISLFGMLGAGVVGSTPHSRHQRRVSFVFVAVSAAVFVAAFGLAGFSYRFAYAPLSDEALDERLESFWVATPPKTTRVFLQNVMSCCGYEKIERLNGTTVFTDAGELSTWRFDSDPVETAAYPPSLTPSANPRRRLSVKLTTPRQLTQTLCPTEAIEPCAPKLKLYVRRVASRTFQLLVALLGSVCVMVAAVGGLLWRPQPRLSNDTPAASWSFMISRALLVLACVSLLFVALTAFFLGLDIVVNWSLFSSTALQLVFPKSVGVAFLVYAAYLVFINIYTLQGVAAVVVHRVFLQAVGRVVLILCGWLCVGLTGYASRFGGSAWKTHLSSFLSRQWDTLTPLTQHRISLEFQCCGFNDPVLVKGKGIVFDRPAAGFECSLAAARGCRHVMEAQIGGSLGWIFVLMLALTLVELLALACSLSILARFRRVKPHEWFVIESRVRFAAGKYRSEVRRSHLLFSLAWRFDRKLTRAQRLTSVGCGLLTTLAVYTTWFAHYGCHRHALKTCQQPDTWRYLGMGIVYGGLAGFSTQLVAHALFESVRNRSDEETSEVAATRQRKEKALLFRGLFSRRPRAFSNRSEAAVADASTAPSVLATPTHATTEERWYAWLTRFTESLFCIAWGLLFVFGCGLATYMTLVLVGIGDSLYGVKFDQGPRETLVLGLLITTTALLAWLAIDLKQRAAPGSSRSAIVFVAVAIASALLLGALGLGVFMASQTLDEDATNWTIRNTNFSVPERLRAAWTSDTNGFFRDRVQQQLQCCGYRDGTDAALRPCPDGIPVKVQYEAVRVDGRVVAESKDEIRDRAGCYAAMMAEFHVMLERVAYVAAAVGVALLTLAVSALFLAYDVLMAKDSKLKLRVAKSAGPHDMRETFEKVVGLKIAAPARGKIFSKFLSNSLESVAPHVVSELAAESLAGATSVSPSSRTVTLSNGQVVASSLTVNRWDTKAGAAVGVPHTVPYPAWIVHVVFAVCGVWLAVMGYLTVVNALQLGVATAWRCVAAWTVGACFHTLLVEPLAVFMRIIFSTLSAWWETTLLARMLRYGREALRISPSADEQAAKYYASLSLYDRIRFNAAVRIQRRLVTRLARRRFLQNVRERREQSHRQLIAHRRHVLKQSIEGFTAEEVEAFRLLFEDADTARLGLVSYQFISQSIYQLGVRVDAALVRGFLFELDPAYADLVDFEHFLYGMHRVRLHHQEEQAVQEAAVAGTLTTQEREAAALAKEEFVSSSSRFGPKADPQARVLVKRQNLMRELREKRESLSYRLMSKVNKLPPLLQRGRSAAAPSTTFSAEENDTDVPVAAAAGVDELNLVEAAATDEAAVPTGSYVLLQNRKLSPKKRALEMVLKKKSREEKDKARATSGASGAVSPTRSPRKMVMPTLRLPGSPRAQSKQKTEGVSPPEPPVQIHAIAEGDETEPPSPPKPIALETSIADAEESKPFGTFMLLAKHTASAGKHKVMEKIQNKQSEQKEAKCDGNDSDEDDAATVAATAGAASEEGATEPAGERPSTAEKREKAQSVAKSSLEKALKKKAAASSARTSSPARR